MTKFIRTLLFLTLILSACSPATLLPEVPPLTNVSGTAASPPAVASTTEPLSTEVIAISTTEVASPPKIIVTLSTPHIDQGPDGAVTESTSSYPQGCGYQWAYQDMPGLSSDFLQSMQALQSEAQARVYGFGENCIHEDGSATFIPMETDFEITFQVPDMTDTAALGEWVVKTMQVIENIPPDQIIGPRPGRVTIVFEFNGQRQGINFYIDQYHALAAGLSPTEIYQTLKSSQ